MAGDVWDTGLQPERTRLAWQRTSLALLSAGLVVARIVGHHDPGVGIAIAASVTLLAGATGVLSTRRYRNANRQLQAEKPLPGGLVNLLMTLTFLAVAFGGLAFIAVSRH